MTGDQPVRPAWVRPVAKGAAELLAYGGRQVEADDLVPVVREVDEKVRQRIAAGEHPDAAQTYVETAAADVIAYRTLTGEPVESLLPAYAVATFMTDKRPDTWWAAYEWAQRK